jgi:tetratricopeptide (TPR) repeat protein
MIIRTLSMALAAMLLATLLVAQEPASKDQPAPAKEALPAKEKAAKEAAAKPDAAAWFEKGRDALFQGETKQAIEFFEKAIAADKNGKKTTCRLNLARAYRYDGKSEASEKLLKQILKDSPDHVEAGQLLAEIHHALHRWKEIVEVLEPLLKYRHDYSTYHMLGEATYHLDDFTKAAEYYQKAIRLNGNSALDHYQLGNIRLAKNRYARAVTSYESALRLGLESPVLHYKLASSYFNLRNYFGKVEVVTASGGKQGTISGRYYLIERVPGKKDVFRVAPSASAIYQIAKAIESSETPPIDIRMLRANTYLSARRFQRAHEFYEELAQAVVKQPKEDRALYHYYFAESALGLAKFDDYLAHLRKAIELDEPTYSSALVDAYGVVAEKYNQLGKLDKYVEFLKLAVRESPQTASLHMKLGNALEEGKAYGEAVQQWRMVLDLEPDHPQRTQLLNLIKKHVHTLAQRNADKAT